MDQDRKFLDTFLIVIGALLAFTVFIYFLATSLERRHLDPDNRDNPYAQQAATERVKPEGRVITAGDPQPRPVPTAAAAQQPAEAAAPSGKEVHDNACFACHGTGAAGAPRTGQAEAWAARIAQGVDVMYDHAINGFQGQTGFMPPKGGRMDLSDEQVKAATDYMIDQSQ